MNEINYERLLEETLERMFQLNHEIEERESELARQRQFAYATRNMVSDQARLRITSKYLDLMVKLQDREASLTDSIRSALQFVYPNWQTAAKVRDLLLERGFDFSGYRSNPLSSISTALRRLSEGGEIEDHEFDGVSAFRAKESSREYLLRRGRELVGGLRISKERGKVFDDK